MSIIETFLYPCKSDSPNDQCIHMTSIYLSIFNSERKITPKKDKDFQKMKNLNAATQTVILIMMSLLQNVKVFNLPFKYYITN